MSINDRELSNNLHKRLQYNSRSVCVLMFGFFSADRKQCSNVSTLKANVETNSDKYFNDMLLSAKVSEVLYNLLFYRFLNMYLPLKIANI